MGSIWSTSFSALPFPLGHPEGPRWVLGGDTGFFVFLVIVLVGGHSS